MIVEIYGYHGKTLASLQSAIDECLKGIAHFERVDEHSNARRVILLPIDKKELLLFLYRFERKKRSARI